MLPALASMVTRQGARSRNRDVDRDKQLVLGSKTKSGTHLKSDFELSRSLSQASAARQSQRKSAVAKTKKVFESQFLQASIGKQKTWSRSYRVTGPEKPQPGEQGEGAAENIYVTKDKA